MIMNNENEKLSRNRKRRIERKIKMDDRMKSLIKKIKSQKKKNTDNFKELEIELVKIKYANELQFALKELNKIQVIHKNLRE